MIPARHLAAELLQKTRNREGFATTLIDEAFAGVSDNPHAASDRRLVMQLVLGVVRRTETLDALIAPFLTRPFRELHPDTLDVLRLGAFQLAFLSGMPPHAAVNETVDILPTHLAGVRNFANAILRRVADLMSEAFVAEPSSRALPTENGQYRVLTREVFPNPALVPAAYLSAAFAWPRWLADRWFARFGFAECCRLGFWFNSPPPLWLRVNKLKLERDDYRLKLTAINIDTLPGEHPQSLKLLDSVRIPELPGYDEGEFAVQDHSAMTVASALNPKAGWNILDLCSAPGGKTTHLAELMHNRGAITACDINQDRLDTVTTLCQRLGISIVQTHLLPEGSDPPAGPFDAALVDVPCSNTGVLGRRPEVRRRLKPHEFEHLIRLQTRLLINAIERVKPGGVVVYSTCSIEPDENENVVRGVLGAMKNVTLEGEAHAVPGQPGDGGYWARLRVG